MMQRSTEALFCSLIHVIIILILKRHVYKYTVYEKSQTVLTNYVG